MSEPAPKKTTVNIPAEVVEFVKGLGADLTNPAQLEFTRNEIEKLMCESHFYYFIRTAWRHAFPRKFYDGPLVAAIAYHAQALWEGQMRTLTVALPPGIGKSSILVTLLSAWIWTKMPGAGQWYSSFGKDNPIRDSLDTRNLIASEWYQKHWGKSVSIREDENQKMFYRNTQSGWRLGVSVRAKVGHGTHPDVIGIDDPLHPKKTGPAELDYLREYLKTTIATRGVVHGCKKFLAGHRLHEMDGHAYLMESEPDAVHLCLPMEFEPERKCRTKIKYFDIDAGMAGLPADRVGWEDWRTEPGQLLWPERYSPERVSQARHDMSPHEFAGQFQQRPTSMSGDMFLVEWFSKQIETHQAPKDLPIVRCWDLASSTGARADYTASARGCFDGEYLYVTDLQEFKSKRKERDEKIMETSRSDNEIAGGRYMVRLEYEGGSGGKDGPEIMCEEIRRDAPCWIDKPEGKPKPSDHALKGWHTIHHLLSRGRVIFVKCDKLRRLIDSCLSAPFGTHDDLVDAVAHLARTLYKPRTGAIKRHLLCITDEDQEVFEAESQRIESERDDGKKVCRECLGLGCVACDHGFVMPRTELEEIFDAACAAGTGDELGVRWG